MAALICAILVLVAGTTSAQIKPMTFEETLQRLHKDVEARKVLDTLDYDSHPMTGIVEAMRKLTDPLQIRQYLMDVGIDAHSPSIPGIDNVTAPCMTALGEIATSIVVYKQLWAYKIIDAAGKPPANLLEPTIYWLGSFSECTKLSIPDYMHFNWKTRFVRAFIPVTLPTTPASKTNVITAVCAPDTCTPTDITNVLNAGIRAVLQNVTNLNTTIVAGADFINESPQLTSAAIASIVILSIFACIMAMATLYDVFFIQTWSATKPEQLPTTMNGRVGAPNGVLKVDEYTPLVNNRTNSPIVSVKHEPGLLGQLLLSFSVYTNAKKMLSTKQGEGTLRCVNGIRFLSLSWVILGHTLVFASPIADNRTSLMMEIMYKGSWQAITNATVSVDTFFLLSGLLMTYLFLKEADKKKGKINWVMFYVHRYWRLTPPYMLVMMTYVPLFEYWATGPMYPQGHEAIDPNCKTDWWENLLYINNLTGMKKMCMGWSWYLANDMQFYVLSPLLLVPFFVFPKIGMILAMFLLTASVTATGIISKHFNLGVANYFAGGKPPTGETMDLIYITPWCRAGPYLVGMITGFIMFKTKCRPVLHWALVLVGWAVAATCCVSVLYGLTNLNDTGITEDAAALYNAVSRTVWAIGVCWVIYACCCGYGGFVNTLMSWKAFIPLSRLTYCGYLVHPVLMYTFYYSREKLIHMDILNLVYYFIGNLTCACGLAFVVSLAFESPFMGMEKAVLKALNKKRI